MIDPTDPISPPAPPAPVATAPEPEAPAPLSPALARFYACRWHKAEGADGPRHCTQSDVRSLAGIAGFSAESWCRDCAYFKVRRGSKKPEPFS